MKVNSIAFKGVYAGEKPEVDGSLGGYDRLLAQENAKYEQNRNTNDIFVRVSNSGENQNVRLVQKGEIVGDIEVNSPLLILEDDEKGNHLTQYKRLKTEHQESIDKINGMSDGELKNYAGEQKVQLAVERAKEHNPKQLVGVKDSLKQILQGEIFTEYGKKEKALFEDFFNQVKVVSKENFAVLKKQANIKLIDVIKNV